MTLAEALEKAKTVPVRHVAMSPLWTMRVDAKGQHWFVNPVTGSHLAFPLSDEDKKADWREVK